PPPPPPPPPPPEPEPEPEPEPKPKPEPKPEAPTPPPPPPRPEEPPEPKQKEKPKDDFASLLKSVEKLAPTSKDKEPDKKAKPQKSATSQSELEKKVPGIASSGTAPYSPDEPLTVMDIDAIRSQIEKCWNVPAGARDAENLVVEVRVRFAPDGRVLDAQIEEDGRMSSDPFYRAAAESARRAVHVCSPIKAPPTKYERWKEVRLRFNPREMLR
ncbi:MAG: TonB C-terminal domain-containing protein, partial [Alphaproteobacteria bacterium]|nr:TonB C-terminal domain-containing protein [Alphaproteobacteria bacterium]